jgi:hypothetical protein
MQKFNFIGKCFRQSLKGILESADEKRMRDRKNCSPYRILLVN